MTAADNPGTSGSAALGKTVIGAGERVVLAHGFTQSARSFARLAQVLAPHHEVVAVDLPGHGGSARCRVAGLSDAAHLLGVTGGRASYVGYSLGARTCLTLALAWPEVVEKLVLVGATAGITSPIERAARRSSDEDLARGIDRGGDAGLESFLRGWLAGPLFAHLNADEADLDARLVNSASGLSASLRTCGTATQEPSWERLGELAMPVLVVAGERDAKFRRLSEELVEGIGENATLAVVAGAGHAVPFEAPDAFSRLLEGFLEAPS